MKKKYFPTTIWETILLLLVAIMLTVPMIIAQLIFKLSVVTTSNIMFVVHLLCVLVIFYIVNKRRNIPISFSLRIDKTIIVFLFIVGLYQLAINTPLIIFTESFFELKAPFEPSFSSVFMLIILAPIIEEIIFRGIILKGFLMRYSATNAILLSSLIFAVIHLNIVQGINAFIFGLFIGYVYFKSKSIGMTILIHFTINSIGLLSVYLHNTYGNTTVSSFQDIYGEYSLPILTTAIIMFIILIYFISKNRVKYL